MRRVIEIFAGLCLLLTVSCGAAFAVQPGEMLDDPALERRARALSAELRCLVCQNQSIDDSDAPLAADLRRLVRERLKANDSDQQVLDFVVARYGEFALLRPPFKISTLLLWMTPLLVLAGGILLALRTTARMASDRAPLSETEKNELAQLLKDKPGD